MKARERLGRAGQAVGDVIEVRLARLIAYCTLHARHVAELIARDVRLEASEEPRQRLKRHDPATTVRMRSEKREESDVSADVQRHSRGRRQPVEERAGLGLVAIPFVPEHLVRDPVVGVRPQSQAPAVGQPASDVAYAMEVLHPLAAAAARAEAARVRVSSRTG